MDKQELMNGSSIGSLVGKPIYSLDTGQCLTTVKDVVYDSTNHRLLGFTVERPGFFSPHRRMLLFDDIKSIGNDAITVQNKEVFTPADRNSDIVRAVERGRTIQGKKILTESGNNLGSISDVLVDTSSGKAISFEVSHGLAADVGGGRNYVSAARTIRMGPDAIIVPNDVEAAFEEQAPGGLAGAYQAARTKAGEYGKNVAQLTDQQKVEMARGKTAGYDVRDDQGMLIVAKGETITDPAIQAAQQQGRLNDLAMSAAAGSATAGYERAKIAAGPAAGTAGTAWEASKANMSRAWADFTDSLNKSMDETSRRRAVGEQKRFLVGKMSATDVRDSKGNLLLQSGDVITPLILDTLDRLGRLEQVKVKPAEAIEQTVARLEPQLHVVVESPAQRKAEKARPHI